MGTLSCEKNKEADVGLHFVACKSSHVNTTVQSKSGDMTESSSSFGDTLSDAENGDNGSDAEVVSEFHGNTMEFDGCDDLLRFRKKRLTDRWRTFIQPVMWRAKWAEMQIRKFKSQAFKYDKILAEKKKRKQLKVDSFAPGLGSKAQPYDNNSRRGKIMKRKKRKRTEDLIDSAMSNHTLFSYFGSKRSIDNANGTGFAQPDAKSGGDGEVTNGLSFLDFQEDPNSWEHLLEKIVRAQLKVDELKDRMHQVTNENAGKISSSSTDMLTLLPPRNNTPASPPINGDRMGKVGHSSVPSQLVHEHNNNNMGDLVMPQSAASSHGEVTLFPNITQSMDQPRVGVSWRSTGDGTEELNELGEEKIHHIDKKLKVPKKEQGTMSPPPMVAQEFLKTDDQLITIPKNKKKRGKRKARTGKMEPELFGLD